MLSGGFELPTQQSQGHQRQSMSLNRVDVPAEWNPGIPRDRRAFNLCLSEMNILRNLKIKIYQ